MRTIVNSKAADLPFSDGHYPLHMLVSSKRYVCLQLYHHQVKAVTKRSCHQHRSSLLPELMKGVENPNVRNKDGMTPLILACRMPLTKDRHYVIDCRRAMVPFIRALLAHPKTGTSPSTLLSKQTGPKEDR